MSKYMDIAINEAQKALKHNDVPVGAVLVCNNKIIAKAHNKREQKQNITRHAEIIALEKACKKKKTWYLNDCEMYVTLEPCMMCLSAINQSRISKVIYALPKQKEEKMNLTKKVIGDGEKEAYLLLNDFFKSKRK